MSEIKQYEQAMDLLIDNLEECNKIIANLKTPAFTNSRQVSIFYGKAKVDIEMAVEHLKNGNKLHKHLIEHYGLKINSNKIWIK